jgi:hypothetical protein
VQVHNIYEYFTSDVQHVAKVCRLHQSSFDKFHVVFAFIKAWKDISHIDKKFVTRDLHFTF